MNNSRNHEEGNMEPTSTVLNRLAPTEKLPFMALFYLPLLCQTPEPIVVFCALHWLNDSIANGKIKPGVTKSDEISCNSRS